MRKERLGQARDGNGMRSQVEPPSPTSSYRTHGFGLLQCEGPACRQKLLVAFSCKGRGWCPSCIGRRMCQGAANWVEHVLPHRRLRQFVLKFPFELRARLAYDRELLSRVTKLFNDCVLGFYRRTLRDLYRAGSGGEECLKKLRDAP